MPPPLRPRASTSAISSYDAGSAEKSVRTVHVRRHDGPRGRRHEYRDGDRQRSGHRTDHDRHRHSATYAGQTGAEGLTPGFWKTNVESKNAVAWPRTDDGSLVSTRPGYSPTASLRDPVLFLSCATRSWCAGAPFRAPARRVDRRQALRDAGIERQRLASKPVCVEDE